MLSDYTPMAPTLVREPFHRDGWIYEEKVDGWRILAYKDGARVRLVSRNGRDHTRRVVQPSRYDRPRRQGDLCLPETSRPSGPARFAIRPGRQDTSRTFVQFPAPPK